MDRGTFLRAVVAALGGTAVAVAVDQCSGEPPRPEPRPRIRQGVSDTERLAANRV